MLLYLEPPFPVFAVFTLDWVLWPYSTNSSACDIARPLNKTSSDGKLYDANGKRLTFYCVVGQIFQLFQEKNISIAVINYSPDENPAIEMITHFGWEKYIAIADVSAIDVKTHLIRVKMMSDIKYEYSDMIFFDATPSNLEVAAELGVHGYLVKNGIQWRDAILCLRQYQNKYKNVTEPAPAPSQTPTPIPTPTSPLSKKVTPTPTPTPQR